MLKTLLKMEFKRSYKSFLIWAIIMVSTLVLFTVIYPIYEDLFVNLPAEMLQMLQGFGGVPTNILEYFTVESASMYLMIGPIYASMLGFNLVSVFEREKSAEILFTTNVDKKYFYFSKMIVLVVLLTSFSLINFLGSYLTMLFFDQSIQVNLLVLYFLMMNISFIVIGIMAFTLALLLNLGTNPLISMTLPIIFIVIQFLGKLTNNAFLTNLLYLTPFAFSDPTTIIVKQNGIEWLNFSIYILISIGLLVFNYYKYQRRVSI